MQKKFSKILALLSALTLSVGCAVGCGGKGDSGSSSSGNGSNTASSDKVEIRLETDNGGLGMAWINNAADRFAELHKDTVWGVDDKGKTKKGVYVTPIGTKTHSISSTTPTSTTAIFEITNVHGMQSVAGNGYVLDLTEIMQEKYDSRAGQKLSIEDKIDEGSRGRYQYNGKYYGAPSVEYYPGMAYNVNLFRDEGYYLSKSTDGDAFHSTILDQDFYFTSDADDKACGPDGEYGTSDDGLPTSLYELIALCEKMKDDGVSPIDFSGYYDEYSNFMLSALMNSMMGYSRALTTYTFDGEAQIITGFSNEKLFPGVDDIKKPIVETVTVTEETGYYVTWSAERYYAEAFMELCINNEWFSSSVSGNKDQKASMQNFVFSGWNGAEKIGMHIDGSFWYNEAKDAKYFDKYAEAAGPGGALDPREVEWMSLPVTFDKTVEEGEGSGQVLVDMWQSMFVVNANVEKNPALKNATLEFIKFLCSDSELSKYTSLTSVIKALDYDLTSADKEAMGSYGQKLWDMVRGDNDNNVLYFAGNNKTFESSGDRFNHSYTNGWFGTGTSYAASFWEYRRNTAKNSKLEDIFKSQVILKAEWEGLYKGNGTVGVIDSITGIN